MTDIPNGFSFNINTNALHIGGSPTTNDANYTGCIKDLSYNFQSVMIIIIIIVFSIYFVLDYFS